MSNGKEYKLDMFEVIRRADAKDYNWFSSLSAEQKQEFNPWLAMRFMTAAPDGIDGLEALLYGDAAMNEHFTIVSKDKDFFYRLMCVAGTGRPKKHFMVSPPKRRREAPLVSEIMSELHAEPMEDHELRLYIEINGLEKEDLADIAYDLAWDDKKIKELKKSFVKFME